MSTFCLFQDISKRFKLLIMKKKGSIPSNQLSVRLNQLIETKGISKAEMARICGVSPQAVNSWFSRGSIGKSSAVTLSDALGVSLAWLLGESESAEHDNSEEIPRSVLSPKEKILLDLFNSIPEKDRDELLAGLQEKEQRYNELYEELKQIEKTRKRVS